MIFRCFAQYHSKIMEETAMKKTTDAQRSQQLFDLKHDLRMLQLALRSGGLTADDAQHARTSVVRIEDALQKLGVLR